MIFTTAGHTTQRPVAAERVLEILAAISLFQRTEKLDADELLSKIIKEVEELPTMALPDGKKLVQKRYPRVLVVDQNYPEDGLHRVGDNIHQRLVIRKSDGGSYVAFINTQSMASTECMEEGYAFAGEWDSDEYELVVPFDTVWVEEADGKE